MNHKYTTIFRWINVIVDYILLNGILYISFALANLNLLWEDVYDYKLTILLLNFTWFYCSHILKIYSSIFEREAVPIVSSTIASLCLFILIAVVIKLLLPTLYIPPTPFIYYFILFPFSILIWRFSFLLLRKHRRSLWLSKNKMIIIGAGPLGVELYNYLTKNHQFTCFVAGIFDDSPASVPSQINYLGKVEDTINYAVLNNVQEVYCALPNSEYARIEAIMQEADKQMIRFRLVPDIKGLIHHNFMVELFGYVPVLKPRQEPLENKANEVIKRAFDISFSLLIIVLILSWLIPLMALLIKLDSRGPVFFKQLRSGKQNKPFYCFKFRSMTVNNDCDSLQACKGDTRITRVGKFIRKTSIDELPQFINVFMGDMSVVGPRPHMLKHTQDYSKIINNYMVRHFLTPGITGWAQVNGYRGETKETVSMLNRVKADLWYLEHWSILLDLKIIFLTIWQGFRDNDKAY